MPGTLCKYLYLGIFILIGKDTRPALIQSRTDRSFSEAATEDSLSSYIYYYSLPSKLWTPVCVFSDSRNLKGNLLWLQRLVNCLVTALKFLSPRWSLITFAWRFVRMIIVNFKKLTISNSLWVLNPSFGFIWVRMLLKTWL